jgi:peptidoglycan hydrolase-like protein with peptidoglycan-binding domain
VKRGRALVLAVAVVVSMASCSGGSGAGGDERAGDVGSVDTTTSTAVERTTTTMALTTTSSTTSTTVAPTTTTTEPPPPPEGEVLETGMVGPRTEALQQRLTELHFDPGPVDGEFGTKTRQAVWAFQHTYGYAADGLVGPELYGAIMNAGAPDPLVPDGGPDRTEISIDRQVLYVYRGGELALVTHISTGNGEDYCENGVCGTAITPTGDFHYERRISGWRESYLGRLYNPVYFKGGYAVHGSGSVPNGPASHGCVRIPMHIAEYFPDLVTNGDPVYVL